MNDTDWDCMLIGQFMPLVGLPVVPGFVSPVEVILVCFTSDQIPLRTKFSHQQW